MNNQYKTQAPEILKRHERKTNTKSSESVRSKTHILHWLFKTTNVICPYQNLFFN